jgi:hypothetical protein
MAVIQNEEEKNDNERYEPPIVSRVFSGGSGGSDRRVPNSATVEHT